MIFAAVDAFHYFRRTGRYSDTALRAQGLLRAKEENFPAWNEWPLGHILFVSTSASLTSWGIMYVSNGPVSHTAMVYGEGILHDVTSVGVHRRPISDYFDGKSFICVMPPPKGTNLEYSKKFMDRTLGSSYNYRGVFLLGLSILIGNDTSICWRAVADIFSVIAGISLFIYFYTGVMPLIPLGIAVMYVVLILINRWRIQKEV